jgi:hypothetical protein
MQLGELIKNMCRLVQAQTHDRTLGEVRSGRKWIKGAHFHKKSHKYQLKPVYIWTRFRKVADAYGFQRKN